MARVSVLWRHPIKAHGRERLERVLLEAGRTMPGDRVWAVAHEAAKTDGSEWASCANFSRAAKAPQLMAIEALYDEGAGVVTLSHPAAGTIRFDPDGDIGAFLDWVAPLMPADRAASARMVRVPGRGMTDSDFPSISLIGRASLDALSERMGRAIEPERFRANIWMDGLSPFEEFDWVGRELRIGQARLKVEERITRCLATTANPVTGARDADTLGALEAGWGHQEFGVFATVSVGGEIATGDVIEVL